MEKYATINVEVGEQDVTRLPKTIPRKASDGFATIESLKSHELSALIDASELQADDGTVG